MALSEQEMMRDLAAADAAGDTELAKRIAFQIKATRQAAADKKLYDPTAGMSGVQKFLAGAGESFDRLGNLFRSDAEVAEREKLNAPLMDTGAGKAGQVVGDIAKGIAAGGVGTMAVKGVAAGIPAAINAVRTGATIPQAAMSAGRVAQAAPTLIPGVVGEAVGGAALSATEAAPADRGEQAVLGALLSGAGEAAGRTVGRFIAPYRTGAKKAGSSRGPQMGTAGERAAQEADVTAITRALGPDVEAALPLSARLPGEAASGPMRAEIALRNLPVVGKGLKHEDKLIRDAYTRALFREAGVEVGDKAVGPQAFRLMDDTLSAREAGLRASAGPIDQQTLAQRLLANEQGYIPNALPSERTAAEEAAARALSAQRDVVPAVGAARGAEQGAEAARQMADAEDVAGLSAAVNDARERAIAARLAAGPNWQEDEAYKAARKEWDQLRRAEQEVRPTAQGANVAERGAERAGAAAQRAETKAQAATAKALKAEQQTGWASFDRLVQDAKGAKTTDELLALTRRANDIFESVRKGTDEAKTAKLDALRGFKNSVYDTLDDALPADQRGGFRELNRQYGMASTLREARDSAGQGAFSPAAVSKTMEDVFGPKQAAKEGLPMQELAGALERRASGSFAAGPEQYKALMAGTLMGEGALGMAQRGAAYLTAPATALLLGTPFGRKLMEAGVPRETAALIAQQLISGAATGQADVPGLF